MSARSSLQAQLEHGVAELGLTLPSGAVERLLDYQALLGRWNAAYNLTAVRDPAQMITRHLLDSLAIAPFVSGESLVDLGTGPGLPGIVLAIAQPERPVMLVDSNGKKVRFLREAIRALKLQGVRAEQARVEHMQGSFDCVTSRAFASLGEMLALGGHLLAPQGRWLAMKGHLPADELGQLPADFELQQVQALQVPDLVGERHLLILARTGVATVA